MNNFTRGALCATISALVLVGCSKGEHSASQVAAKVNGEEISVHQINFLLQRANVKPEQAKAASQQALSKLIEESLLVQKATDKKLDRDPAVMQQIEAAKREIIARAYIERMGADASKPSESDISDYFAKHPELFSQRRIYSLREVDVAGDASVQSKLRETLPSAKSLEDVVAWLKKENIAYRTDASVKPAEQLPLNLLPRLQQMKDGQLAAIPSPNGVVLLQLLASKEEPVNVQQARPVIEKFLSNKTKSELAQKEMKTLRDTAKIEYMGEFKESASAPLATPAAPATPASAASAAVSDLEKGLAAGIK